MTCHEAQAQLDDYIDGALNRDDSARMAEHLSRCRECRDEYDAALRLLNLMRGSRVVDPGHDYWPETTALILARTSEARSEPGGTDDAWVRREHRRSFVRAALSLAASVALLVGALSIGPYRDQLTASSTRIGSERPLLIANSVRRQLPAGEWTVPSDDETRLACSMLLMGSPGLPGRVPLLAAVIMTPGK